MKRSLFAAAAAAFVFAGGSALAADLPRKAPVTKAPPPVYYSWAGFYVGAHGGYGWSSTDWTQVHDNNSLTNTAPGTSFSLDPRGGIFGGQAGYNWQSGRWVFGVEVSGSWTDLKESALIPLPAQFDDTFTARIRGLVLATARLGVASDRTLVFVKGGYGGANVKASAVDTVTNGGQVGSAPNTWEDNRWHHGWTVGGGFGFKVTPNVSLEVDYNYVQLQSKDHSATVLNSVGAPVNGAGSASTATYDIDARIHAVMGRLNYHFGGPLVARY